MDKNELEKYRRFKKLERFIEAYQKAINELDDYFEYRMDSTRDQKVVHRILDELAFNLVDACKRRRDGQ